MATEDVEPKGKKPKAVKMTPTTALDRGQDLLSRILDKKKTAESHKTVLSTLSFAGDLVTELTKFSKIWEPLA